MEEGCGVAKRPSGVASRKVLSIGCQLASLVAGKKSLCCKGFPLWTMLKILKKRR